jgi:hypothetical protein
MTASTRPSASPSGSGQKRDASPRPSAGQVARRVVQDEGVSLDLPLIGRVNLPPLYHLGWYAGVATLAAIEIIEWPIAAVLAVGKMLADNHHSRLLVEFGEALEEGG